MSKPPNLARGTASEVTGEKTRHAMCLIYLLADDFLRLPTLDTAEEPHQGGVFQDSREDP